MSGEVASELESTPDELVTLRLRVEAEMTAEPEIVKSLAPHLSAALLALLYHDLKEGQK